MDYEAEISNLKDKVGQICNTVEMDLRLEVRDIKIKNNKILNIVGEILKCLK